MFSEDAHTYSVQIFETSASGHALTEIPQGNGTHQAISITLNPTKQYQEILGFGGSFTEASAHLLQSMSNKQREKILHAYFSDEGARYSLTRTHINSCDFSLGHYAYDMIPGDTTLQHFSIEKDKQ